MSNYLTDVQTLLQAGINPNVRRKVLPETKLKNAIKLRLRIDDEADAISRYTWDGIPAEISSNELERLLYFKGQLCLFYDETLEQYYFMPYALDGTIDFYGRFNTIHPIPMTSGTDASSEKEQASYLSNKKLKVIYKKDAQNIDKTKCTALLFDYKNQLSQTLIPNAIIQEELLDCMSDLIPYMKTNLLANTGVKGVRVADANQADSVRDANASMKTAALTGNCNVPIVGQMEFQELTGNSAAKSEEFMEALQSLDNFRLSHYGINSGGVFQKKAHMLKDEEKKNGVQASSRLELGLELRQEFCDIANAIFGTNMTVRINENAQAQCNESVNDEDEENEAEDIEDVQ